MDASGGFALITTTNTNYLDPSDPAGNYMYVGDLHNAQYTLTPTCASVEVYSY